MFTFSRQIKNLLTALTVAAAAILSSCIHNDLPYPYIQPNFTDFLVNGLARPAEIDTVNRIISLEFDEETDLQNVELVSYTLSPEGSRVSDEQLLGSSLNLLRPV